MSIFNCKKNKKTGDPLYNVLESRKSIVFHNSHKSFGASKELGGSEEYLCKLKVLILGKI